MFIVRAPLRSESAAVAELILQSDCGTLPALFGPGVRQLLEHLLGRPGNPYRSSNVLVAVEEPGQNVAGAAVGSPASTTRADSLRTVWELARWYGPAAALRFPRLSRAGRSMASLAPHDYYLAHIAVRPDRRSSGIGARLLGAVEERARALGARRMALDVDEHNVRARAFYLRQGYRPVSVVRIDLGRHGVFVLQRMLREL